MLFRDAFKTSTRSLVHGKMRSILTMLGIVIGIASVIAMVSVGEGASSGIQSSIQSLGSNLIEVLPGAAPTAVDRPSASSKARKKPSGRRPSHAANATKS